MTPWCVREVGHRGRQEGRNVSATAVRTRTSAFDLEREGETVVMTPFRDLPNRDCPESLSLANEVLRALDDTPAKNVVVDLRKAGRFGPAALHLYLRLWKGVRDRDGRMALCNVSHGDRELLSATSLDSMWPVCPTRDMALETVKG